MENKIISYRLPLCSGNSDGMMHMRNLLLYCCINSVVLFFKEQQMKKRQPNINPDLVAWPPTCVSHLQPN